MSPNTMLMAPSIARQRSWALLSRIVLVCRTAVACRKDAMEGSRAVPGIGDGRSPDGSTLQVQLADSH
jgi:hypothetical protein